MMRAADQPALAATHFRAAHHDAELVGGRYLIGLSALLAAAAESFVEPRAGLRRLLDALDWHLSSGSPMGINRAALRDFLPPWTVSGCTTWS